MPRNPAAELINMTYELGWDAEKRPVAAYHRYDTNGRSQIFVSRADGRGNWQTRQISDWEFPLGVSRSRFSGETGVRRSAAPEAEAISSSSFPQTGGSGPLAAKWQDARRIGTTAPAKEFTESFREATWEFSRFAGADAKVAVGRHAVAAPMGNARDQP